MERRTAVPFWRDVRVLTAISQAAFVLSVAIVGGFFYANLSSAMRQRGLVAGFDFLNLTSGFEIGESLIPYRPTDTYGGAFFVGLLNTLLVSAVGIVLATILGFVVGVARLSSNWLINRIAAIYIEIIRNTPLLVQLVFIYFGVFVRLPPAREGLNLGDVFFVNQRGVFLPRPVLTPTFSTWLILLFLGLLVAILLARVLMIRLRRVLLPWSIGSIVFVLFAVLGWVSAGERPITLDLPIPGRFNFAGGLSLSPEFSALLTGLVIYTAAFIAEVVRGGLQAVKRGQIEAARAVGLGEMQILRLVIFPQAMRVIIPPLTSQYLNLAKNSSLAIAIGYPDLFAVSATIMNQTGQPVPVFILVMATYLSMSLSTSLLMNIYNKSVQILEK